MEVEIFRDRKKREEFENSQAISIENKIGGMRDVFELEKLMR